MAETYVSRPHFEELTLHSPKMCVFASFFWEIVLFFANNAAEDLASSPPRAGLDPELWARGARSVAHALAPLKKKDRIFSSVLM